MLKIGFIGFGRMGITHFSILNSHPSVKVAAIADTSKTMRGLVSKYLEVTTYSDYQTMITEAALDCVVISTPTDSHAEVITFALEHNLHVFAEKPLAMSPAESAKLVEMSTDRALVNQVGYVNRFNEVFIEVKQLIESGVIGDIKNFTSEMYGATVLKGSNATWRSKRKSGGGCMYEFASHCLDLAVYLLGQPDRVAGSILKKIYSTHVEDMVTSTLIYADGTSGTISVNWSDESNRKPANIVTFFGTRGKIVADKHAYKIYLKEDLPHYGFHQGWNTKYITEFAQPVRFYVRGNEFTRQLDYFIDAILEQRKENISSFAEAHKTDLLMDSIVSDAQAKASTPVGRPNLIESPTISTLKLTWWQQLLKKVGFKYA